MVILDYVFFKLNIIALKILPYVKWCKFHKIHQGTVYTRSLLYEE